MKNKPKKAIVPSWDVDESLGLKEQIAQRAHELWHQRGREHGADLVDWFQAEREVNQWHQQRVRNSG